MAFDIGRVGIWTGAFDGHPAPRIQEAAQQVEALGFPTLWIPEGTGRDPFVTAGLLLSATSQLRVATRDPQARHPFSWAGGPDEYSARAIDQGIGRALWFVGGTDADVVADLIAAYPAHRRGDLYAGAGLAATYAGAADEEELRRLAERAGEHRLRLAQGSASDSGHTR